MSYDRPRFAFSAFSSELRLASSVEWGEGKFLHVSVDQPRKGQLGKNSCVKESN